EGGGGSTGARGGGRGSIRRWRLHRRPPTRPYHPRRPQLLPRPDPQPGPRGGPLRRVVLARRDRRPHPAVQGEPVTDSIETTPPTPPAAPQTTPAGRLFTATLIIGVPGSGKTSLFKTYAEYLWETYQKVLLLYSWDGGAIPTQVQQRMRQGLIRFWRARTRSAEGLGLETLYLASRGYWPRRINAMTGETSPAIEMVPPVTTKYRVRCQAGHDLQTVPVRSLVVPMFCSACGQFVAQPD